MVEGRLRVCGDWTWNVAGHTVSWNTFVPALVTLGLIFTAAALWPFLEQWITGDRREHHINDRPRNAPTRTALGMAAITFWGVFWLEGANDVIAFQLNIPLYVTTEIARYAVFIGPVVAYWVTQRICVGLQRKDVHLLEHGVETGIIRQLPDGEYIEVTRPVDEEKLAVLEARSQLPQIEAPVGDDVPAPSARGGLGKLRVSLNRVLNESIPLPQGNGHGNGHRGNGHGNGHAGEPTAVPTRGPVPPAGGVVPGRQAHGAGRGDLRGGQRAAAGARHHHLVRGAAGHQLPPGQEPDRPAVAPGALERAAHDRDRVADQRMVV